MPLKIEKLPEDIKQLVGYTIQGANMIPQGLQLILTNPIDEGQSVLELRGDFTAVKSAISIGGGIPIVIQPSLQIKTGTIKSSDNAEG